MGLLEDPKNPSEPEYDYFHGTTRTFLAKIENNGTLVLKRSVNMEKIRCMH
jgi:hypothetical protein